jgi:hypothetical protein
LITVFIIVWGIYEVCPIVHTKKTKSLLYVICAVMVIICNLFIMTPFMDGERERFSTVFRILLYIPMLIFIFTIASKDIYLTDASKNS